MSQAQIIKGKPIAADLQTRIEKAVADIKAEHGIIPGLAVVLVGDDPASQIYVNSKAKTTVALGMQSFKHVLPAETTQEELLSLINNLNNDPAVHGILVQLPVPDHIDSKVIIEAISPKKDVDGLHPMNAGYLALGQKGFVSCTPLGCLIMLKQIHQNLSGLHAVIMGRSHLVGKPIAQLLLNENCTVTMAHSRTRNIEQVVYQADILVVAVGSPKLVKAEWVKPGATVIDVGINRIPAPERGEGKTRVVGDVDYTNVKEIAGFITPVPGGVGPMTVACLLRNTVQAACTISGIEMPDI